MPPPLKIGLKSKPDQEQQYSVKEKGQDTGQEVCELKETSLALPTPRGLNSGKNLYSRPRVGWKAQQTREDERKQDGERQVKANNSHYLAQPHLSHALKRHAGLHPVRVRRPQFLLQVVHEVSEGREVGLQHPFDGLDGSALALCCGSPVVLEKVDEPLTAGTSVRGTRGFREL